MTDSYEYIPEVLGMCDNCNRPVMEDEDHLYDESGFIHAACNPSAGESDGSE